FRVLHTTGVSSRECAQTYRLNKPTPKSARSRKQLKQEHGKDMDAVDFAVVPQQEYMVGNVRNALLLIFVAVGFLLLVACANVANLLLAQVTTRQKDFAV